MASGEIHLPRTLALLEQGRAAGLHLGAQLYVSRRGQTVADLALGDAQIGGDLRPRRLAKFFRLC